MYLLLHAALTEVSRKTKKFLGNFDGFPPSDSILLRINCYCAEFEVCQGIPKGRKDAAVERNNNLEMSDWV